VTNSTSFSLTCSGADDPGGSGIASYAVNVSDNGGPFTLWQNFPATQTSATFSGQPGHTYGFYSVATDNVGNVQPTPSAAQATTLVPFPSSAITVGGAADPNYTITFVPGTLTIRGITAQLVAVKVGKKKRLVVRVFFADTGAKKSEFASPFQKPAFKNIQVSIHDGQVVVTAKKGKKTVTATFSA
jgi:hypothetical protein